MMEWDVDLCVSPWVTLCQLFPVLGLANRLEGSGAEVGGGDFVLHCAADGDLEGLGAVWNAHYGQDGYSNLYTAHNMDTKLEHPYKGSSVPVPYHWSEQCP